MNVIEGILFAIGMILMIGVGIGGATMLISWITGTSIRTGYYSRNVMHPNYLPDLIKAAGRLPEKLKDKTKDEINRITSIINNQTSPKIEKLKELGKLKEDGIINNEEFDLLKQEILKNK